MGAVQFREEWLIVIGSAGNFFARFWDMVALEFLILVATLLELVWQGLLRESGYELSGYGGLINKSEAWNEIGLAGSWEVKMKRGYSTCLELEE